MGNVVGTRSFDYVSLVLTANILKWVPGQKFGPPILEHLLQGSNERVLLCYCSLHALESGGRTEVGREAGREDRGGREGGMEGGQRRGEGGQRRDGGREGGMEGGQRRDGGRTEEGGGRTEEGWREDRGGMEGGQRRDGGRTEEGEGREGKEEMGRVVSKRG